MKKEYRKSLKKVFTKKLTEKVVDANLWSKKSDYIFPGEIVYSLENKYDASVFIILIPNQKNDSFNIEIAWSKKGGFPELSVRPNSMFIEQKVADEYAIRLSCINGGADRFWMIPKEKFTDPLEEIIADMKKPSEEEAVILLTPLIDDCIQEILDVAIPFINKALKGNS